MNSEEGKLKEVDTTQLTIDIETKLGRRMRTPADFRTLRSAIWESVHEAIGISTLMRIWNYVSDEVKPRMSTLDVLARYLGFASYEAYSHIDVSEHIKSSDIILGRGINVEEQLEPGDRLRLTWHPDRVCDIVYLGNGCFRVVAVEQTHLHVGDTFQCQMIINNEPLYLNQLRHDNLPPMIYACGLRGGVSYV